MKPVTLGIRWPQWHTLMFSDEIQIDMEIGFVRKMFEKMLIQRARSVFWKKWAAKHGYEELKEGAWLEPRQALLRQKVKENWTEKHRNVARKIFLEGGWTKQRRDYSMLIGRISVNVKHARRRKAQKSTGSTTAQNGTKSDERFQRFSGSWSKKQEPQRRSGSGKEVLLNILSVEVNGTGAISV